MATKSKVQTTKKPGSAPRKTQPSTEFTLFAPEAGEVLLVGDFTEWSAGDCRMRKFKDGIWKKKVNLKPGRYEYRFVVDGQWQSDPGNNNSNPNPYGSENSVLIVS